MNHYIHIELDGFIGKDAIVRKRRSDGRPYIKFRLAHSIFKEGNRTTRWFNVLSFEPNIIEKVELLRKGTFIEIEGDYMDKTYTNPTTGETEIDRDIFASHIGFPERPKKRNKSRKNSESHGEEEGN